MGNIKHMENFCGARWYIAFFYSIRPGIFLTCPRNLSFLFNPNDVRTAEFCCFGSAILEFCGDPSFRFISVQLVFFCHLAEWIVRILFENGWAGLPAGSADGAVFAIEYDFHDRILFFLFTIFRTRIPVECRYQKRADDYSAPIMKVYPVLRLRLSCKKRLKQDHCRSWFRVLRELLFWSWGR